MYHLLRATVRIVVVMCAAATATVVVYRTNLIAGASRAQSDAVKSPRVASTRPRSRFLAEYVAVLLAAGPDAQTSMLARALDDATILPLSDDAKRAFLGSLLQQSWTADHPTGSLLRGLVTSTARFFMAFDRPREGFRPIQVDILQNQVRWIGTSDRATAAMRALAPAILQPLRKRAVELAADNRLAPEHRALVNQLLAIIKLR